MESWGKLAPLYPIFLATLVALHTTQALVLQNQPSSSSDSSQIIARTEQPTILKPYTGDGAPPVAWNLLSKGHPLEYKPTESNFTLRLSLKDQRANIIYSESIYALTVLTLADVATSIATTGGNTNIPPSGQGHLAFTSFQHIYFAMVVSTITPIDALTDVLRGLQELTHYLFFLELTFEVWSDTWPTDYPIATGCLAFDCSHMKALQTRDLEYANLSATNVSAVPLRRLQSSNAPIQLTNANEIDSVSVTYKELGEPLPIDDQSFADVADRILANITDLIIANQGDGLLPFYGTNRRLFHVEDTWGSHLGISLLPYNLLGVGFTLVQAAKALRATQTRLIHGPLVESKMEIYVDGAMIGWGCLRYTNTSAWRCLMPNPDTMSSGGSQSMYGAEGAIHDLNASS